MATKQEILLNTLANVILEYDPNVDVGPGAIRSILLSSATRLVEVIQDAVQGVIDRYDLSQLADITDEDLLNDIASRYGVIRGSAGVASGVVTVVLDTDFPLVIPAGTTLVGSAGNYATSSSFSFKISASSVINANDRLLVARGDGTYVANINVVADTAGSALNITQGESLAFATAVDHVTEVFASQDFLGGEDVDAGVALLDRIANSFVRPGTESAFSIQSLIQHESAFPTVTAVSVVGAGDTEMQRDKQNILSIGGGMSDVYVRTRKSPSAITVAKSATLLDTTAGLTTWSIYIDRNDLPGWWDVVAITDSLGNPAELLNDSRSVDLSPEIGQLTPYIENPTFGVYSAFQVSTLTVRTLASVTDPVFTVTLRGMPDIASIQRLVGGRDYRATGGDILIKAPIPCFVSINMELERNTNASTFPSNQELISSVVDSVNSTGFQGKLYASQIAEAVAGDGYSVTNVTLYATTFLPDGTQRTSISETGITVPVEPTSQTSWRTVVFVTSPSKVSINKRAPTSDLLL